MLVLFFLQKDRREVQTAVLCRCISMQTGLFVIFGLPVHEWQTTTKAPFIMWRNHLKVFSCLVNDFKYSLYTFQISSIVKKHEFEAILKCFITFCRTKFWARWVVCKILSSSNYSISTVCLDRNSLVSNIINFQNYNYLKLK